MAHSVSKNPQRTTRIYAQIKITIHYHVD